MRDSAKTPTPSHSSAPVLYEGQPVVTTEQVALFYGVPQKRVRDNYQNNRSRFEEGKHCVTLTGAALKAFKRDTENFGVVASNVNSLTLWTRRGAARHAKMLNSDKAWEAFEALEDSYFLPQERERLNGSAKMAQRVPADAIPDGDPFTRFAAARLMRLPGGRLSNPALVRAQEIWSLERGLPPLTGRALDAAMRAAGFAAMRSDGKCWIGAALRPLPPEEAAGAGAAIPTAPMAHENRAAVAAAMERVVATADAGGEINGVRLTYLASNLRRAEDMAREIGAPLETAACWGWIAARMSAVHDLGPMAQMELLADISGLPHEQRMAMANALRAAAAAGGAS